MKEACSWASEAIQHSVTLVGTEVATYAWPWMLVSVRPTTSDIMAADKFSYFTAQLTIKKLRRVIVTLFFVRGVQKLEDEC